MNRKNDFNDIANMKSFIIINKFENTPQHPKKNEFRPKLCLL